MTRINFTSLVLLLTSQVLSSQIRNLESLDIQISGNCSMCESRIEKAGFKKKIAKVDWDENTKIAQISFDKKKTTLVEILKRIALAGYDNEQFLAPDDVYNKLPSCCQYKRRVPNSMQNNTIHDSFIKNPPSENIEAEKKGIPIQNLQNDNLKLVYKAYFELKDALVKSSEILAMQKANELVKELTAINSNLAIPEKKSLWTNLQAELTKDAILISKTQKIELQRLYFISLSANMYNLLKHFKPEEPVYYQFCPMANDGIGANWLSKESTIKNPYYGNKMLSCGKTIETINP